VERTGERGMELVNKLGVQACVIKGKEDVICTPGGYITCEVSGGYKRPGGIGDVLAGVMTTFLGWRTKGKEEMTVEEAAWGACAVVREASRRAYGNRKRAMGAEDVIKELEGVVEDVDPIFGDGNN